MDSFREEYIPNKGRIEDVIKYDRQIRLRDEELRLIIYDVVAYPINDHLTPTSYYRGSDGVLIVFDVTNNHSMSGVKQWLQQIDRYCGENIPRIIVANKCDKNEGVATCGKLRQDCEEVGVEYWETSAKTSFNVEEVFACLTLLIQDQKKEQAVKHGQ